MLGQQLASLRLTLEKIFFFTSNYVLLVLFLAPVVTDFYQQTSKIRAQINQIFLAR